MKNIFRYIAIYLSFLSFYACSREVTQEDLIKAAVDIKYKQWEESQFKACKEKAVDKADHYVDSLLLAISLGSKLDTIPKPAKPLKPLKPEFKEKPDSVVVSPIYKKD